MLLQKFKPNVLLLALCAGASLQAATINIGTTYDVVNLGGLGGTTAAARAMDQHGATAGMATDIFGASHATAFNASATGVTLNTSASGSMATGINAAQQVSGTQWFDGKAYATRWAADGTPQVVGGAGSYGNAINASGQMTGMLTVDGQGHLFTASETGAVIDLGTMPGGAWSTGYGINDSGVIAGYGMSGNHFGAFTWSEGSGYTALEGLGGNNSYAMAINNQGEVVGQAQNGYGLMRAVMWVNGSVQSLGTLGGNGSYAYGINGLSQVVGYSWTKNGERHAFVYSGGLMLDLNDLIDPNSGWLLTEAYAINDAGQIAGSGRLNGRTQAFRLDLSDLTLQITGIFGGGGNQPGGGGDGGQGGPGPGGPGGGGTNPPPTNFPPGSTGGNVSPVPEPGTWLLMLTGAGLLALVRWSTQRRRYSQLKNRLVPRTQ